MNGLVTLTVVLANVGNVNVPGCTDQVYKLCQRPVEQRAAAELQALKPDLAALIEILPPELCAAVPLDNPYNLCSAPLEPPSQVVRLLGPGVAHGCDARHGWDCLAVRREGPVAFDGRLDTRPVQADCEDGGFTLNVGIVRVAGWPVPVSVAHPSSTDARCRANQLRDLFEKGLPSDGPALVLGDLNLDPYREEDESVAYYREQVPKDFKPVSSDDFTSYPGSPSQLDPTGQAMDGPVFLPAGPLGPRAIDHVLAREAEGTCEVRRVDGGGGMDHRAQVCRITFWAQATPRVRVFAGRCRVTVGVVPTPAHLQGVRVSFGKRRAVVDRRAPFTFRRRGRGRRVVVQPMVSTGSGPRWCAASRRSAGAAPPEADACVTSC